MKKFYAIAAYDVAGILTLVDPATMVHDHKKNEFDTIEEAQVAISEEGRFGDIELKIVKIEIIE